MSSHQHPVPDLILEQYSLGELPPEKMLEIEERMVTDPGIAERLEALRLSNERILESLTPAEFAAGVQRRLHMRNTAERVRCESRGSSPRRWFVLAPVLSAAMVIVFLLMPRGEHVVIDPVNPDFATRIKGLDPHLKIYRQTDLEPQLLAEDSMVASGDVLQISYVAAGRHFGTIVSVDGRGALTLHFPEVRTAESELVQDGETPIPFAYELDDAPEFERFFFITSKDSISVPVVLNAVSHVASEPAIAVNCSLSLPPEYEQHSLLLRKMEARK